MELNRFIENFAEQFNNTPQNEFTSDTNFWELEEWSSLTALAVVSMIDEEYGVVLRSTDVKGVRTIRELYEAVKIKLSRSLGETHT